MVGQQVIPYVYHDSGTWLQENHTIYHAAIQDTLVDSLKAVYESSCTHLQSRPILSRYDIASTIVRLIGSISS